MDIDIFKLIISIMLSQITNIIGAIIYGRFVDSWFINLKKPNILISRSAMMTARVFIATLMGILFYLSWISPKSLEKNVVMSLLIMISITGIFSPYYLLVKKSIAASATTTVLSLVLGITLVIISLSVSAIIGYLSLFFIAWTAYLLITTIMMAILNAKKQAI